MNIEFEKLDERQKSAVVLIAIGIILLTFFPIIARSVGLYFLGIGFWVVLRIIAAVVLIVLGVFRLVQHDVTEPVISLPDQMPETATPGIEDPVYTREAGAACKVVNVTLTGGIVGMLADSPQNKLNRVISEASQSGWRVVQIIPASSGNIFLMIIRLLLLLVTMFFYTQANGYYVVLERRG